MRHYSEPKETHTQDTILRSTAKFRSDQHEAVTSPLTATVHHGA